MNKRLVWAGWVCLSAVLLASPALCDEGEVTTPEEIQKLHAAFTKPGKIITVKEANDALTNEETWTAGLGKMKPATKLQVQQIRTLGHLALGDVAAADTTLKSLRNLDPKEKSLPEYEYFVAYASGDAKRAAEALKGLKDSDSRLARAGAARQRGLKYVGQEAPKIEIPCLDERLYDVNPRNATPLVLFFWSARGKPKDEDFAAAQAMHKEFTDLDADMDLLALNIDGAAKIEDAVALAEKKELKWTLCFESLMEKSKDVKLPSKAFGVSEPPACVLVDRANKVRAVGDPTAVEFHYAARAARAEANGEHTYIEPKPLEEKGKTKDEKP